MKVASSGAGSHRSATESGARSDMSHAVPGSQSQRTARRVLGGAHPTTTEIEKALELLRLLRANEKIVGVRPKNSLDKIQTNTT